MVSPTMRISNLCSFDLVKENVLRSFGPSFEEVQKLKSQVQTSINLLFVLITQKEVINCPVSFCSHLGGFLKFCYKTITGCASFIRLCSCSDPATALLRVQVCVPWTWHNTVVPVFCQPLLLRQIILSGLC